MGESMETRPIPSAPTSTTQRDSRKGTLVLSVPENAKVVVNGVETRTTGSLRRYVSHGLKPGQAYRYQVKTLVEKNGEVVEESREAILRAGEVTRLAMAADQAPVQTRLTLRVPADAKVYLSGKSTQSSGEVRRFSSSRIAKGEQWADYDVRVTVERGGRTITKEKRISLAGGDESEIAFDFDQTELADAR